MILITGGTGFLGHALDIKLNELNILHKSIGSKDGDLRNLDICSKIFSDIKPDIVINCASDSGGLAYAMHNPADLFYNNTMLMLNQYKCAVDYNVKRFVNPISNCHILVD